MDKKTLYVVGGVSAAALVLYLVLKPKATTTSIVPLTPAQIAALKVQQQQQQSGLTGTVGSITALINNLFGKKTVAPSPAAIGVWANGVRKNPNGSIDYDNEDGTFTEYDANTNNPTVYNNDGSILDYYSH